MRANCEIVQGDFLGGEIEGGVFHHFPESLPGESARVDDHSGPPVAPKRPATADSTVVVNSDAAIAADPNSEVTETAS
jgi:hypothetical protein